MLGEYNKNVSNPFLPMFEKLRDLAFQKHTYKHTTIGFLDDIKAMPGYYEYSLQFFDRFYRPENVTLLVVGDVQPRQVVASWRRSTTATGRRATRRPRSQAEPPQTAAKKAHIDWPNPIPPLPDGSATTCRPSRPTSADTAAARPRRPAPVQRIGAALPGAGGRQAVGGLHRRRRRPAPRPLSLHRTSPGSRRTTWCRKVKETIDRLHRGAPGETGRSAAAGAHQVPPALRLRPRPRHARRRWPTRPPIAIAVAGDIGAINEPLPAVREGDAGRHPAGRPRDLQAAANETIVTLFAPRRQPGGRPTGRPSRAPQGGRQTMTDRTRTAARRGPGVLDAAWPARPRRPRSPPPRPNDRDSRQAGAIETVTLPQPTRRWSPSA